MVPSKLFHSAAKLPSITGFQLAYKRLVLPVALLALIANQSTRDITIATLADSFWAVSCYVAFTLAVYHHLSNFMSSKNKLITLYHSSRSHQVVFASLLGALPGCGGAIVVTTQFINGRVGFGSVVAVLTSTMGDAAFLLLASSPKVGLGIVLMGIIVGSLSGLIVNLFHADDFLRPKKSMQEADNRSDIEHSSLEHKAINLQGIFWKWVLIPATVIALLDSFQVDINELFQLQESTMEWVGAVLAVSSMLLWSLTKDIKDYQSTVAEDEKSLSSHPIQKTAQDTNFVSAWVIMAFMLFELSIFFTQLDLVSLVSGWGIWMPMIGLAVGLLPGCGPQILITSLYLSGVMPLSAQISNSISNDGDALFPAIAMAPKAAAVATIYSAFPAFLVGYAFYFMFEL